MYDSALDLSVVCIIWSRTVRVHLCLCLRITYAQYLNVTHIRATLKWTQPNDTYRNAVCAHVFVSGFFSRLFEKHKFSVWTYPFLCLFLLKRNLHQKLHINLFWNKTNKRERERENAIVRMKWMQTTTTTTKLINNLYRREWNIMHLVKHPVQ